MFCFTIRREDTSSVEVNNNVRHVYFTKNKAMKRIMFDLINNDNKLKTIMIAKKRKPNK